MGFHTTQSLLNVPKFLFRHPHRFPIGYFGFLIRTRPAPSSHSGSLLFCVTSQVIKSVGDLTIVGFFIHEEIGHKIDGDGNRRYKDQAHDSDQSHMPCFQSHVFGSTGTNTTNLLVSGITVQVAAAALSISTPAAAAAILAPVPVFAIPCITL